MNNPYEYGSKQAKVTKGREEMASEVIVIQTSHAPQENKERGIAKDVYGYFGILASSTGTDRCTYYPYTKDGEVVGYKSRGVGKTFHAIGDLRDVDMFGVNLVQTVPAKLFIVEGEEDAVALWSALWTHQSASGYEGLPPAVLSLPHGSNAPNMTKGDRRLIDGSREVIFVPDNDEAGEASLVKILALLPYEKTLVVRLPLKDASEMLQKGRGKELAETALFKGKHHQPTSIVTPISLLADLKTPPAFGYDWPWSELTAATYGIQTGRIYGVGGGVGSSKTAFCHMVMAGLLKQGLVVGGVLLEEDSVETIRAVVGISHGRNYRDPTKAEGIPRLLEGAKDIGDKLLLNGDGEIEELEQAKSLIVSMVALGGAKVIFVDPISDLVAGLSASEANEGINSFLKVMESLCSKLNFALVITSHLNPNKTGKPHEEGGAVSLQSFTGSRGIMRKASVCIGLERNAKASNGDDLYNRFIRLKSRGCNPEAPKVFVTKFDTGSGRMGVQPGMEYLPESDTDEGSDFELPEGWSK